MRPPESRTEELPQCASTFQAAESVLRPRDGLALQFVRYYEPTCGRFINQDPIGLAGGDNLYQFAPNGLGWIDFLGLKAWVAYENKIRSMYKLQPKRKYQASGCSGIADGITRISGQRIAIEAKYVSKWESSIRNPNSKIGQKGFAKCEQEKMVDQAARYSRGFDGAIYHTNSKELAEHYGKIFSDKGFNIKFIITAA